MLALGLHPNTPAAESEAARREAWKLLERDRIRKESLEGASLYRKDVLAWLKEKRRDWKGFASEYERRMLEFRGHLAYPNPLTKEPTEAFSAGFRAGYESSVREWLE